MSAALRLLGLAALAVLALAAVLAAAAWVYLKQPKFDAPASGAHLAFAARR